ncbi:LptA/OstA family protein [Deinococcus radiodurans]|jgi:OstA-like protein.|uniref:Organic solvent tolerance-like N-terminal domain-containing protein n=1 Tax=Deinococcus radiodurans (strain ATCC 13939 / DSM 20539 / JCM 16871 / CCUG 27074 / LMG 4051 / NBRC 15346 / NCIMB 9279 / VKM B-1422 / R1) TaxID=243230 RepID=Q9RS07_DEIRA|nr:LptA/OstA family protein [Deinococcus radiodurans]AAF11869.1 hypothetical protein DR_2320 [Deinococcus radiodurans R1 = ATCC 13939 = DSM 20539]ANC70626.1 OstA family protein [Deinococcus radiodurans R1 = ATCC 13939 = DSM 20539]QEM71700.1 OstA family protein [Deinococcus radiodurans]UDL01342.1 OstA family protein [Deinococcus radiodurans R1 = ATCC 13939 = DSM 20539]UID71281.1 OstA family protein [Deinococcus radiodurans R1 = ATCC 13939 = DSM 20539]
MPERRFLPAPLLGVSLLTAALCGSVLWGAAHAQDTAPAPQSAPATAQPAASSTETAPTQTAPSPSEAAPDINAPTAHEQAGRCVEGTEQTCMDLVRRSKDGEERRIMVIRTGSDDTTGIYALCTPQDDEPEDAPNVGVFSESGAGGIRIVIDKNLIQAPLAVVTQQAAKSDGEGEAAEGSDGRVEASSGTARFLDDVPEGQTDRLARCGVAVDRKPTPGTVRVTQGKTHLTGQTLNYDGDDGIARIAGPITFQRDDQEDPLSGESKNIEINVDTEATVLVGDVVLRSKGGRVSKAGRVEYDDQANTARLYATPEQPAESVRGNDVLRISSGVIVYNLEKNEVYTNAGEGGNITGEFQDEAAPDTSP